MTRPSLKKLGSMLSWAVAQGDRPQVVAMLKRQIIARKAEMETKRRLRNLARAAERFIGNN